MSRVAILDTKICDDILNCNTYKSFNVLGSRGNDTIPSKYSHGSICAQILDGLTKNYDLISIEVLENVPMNQGKPRGYLSDLRKGLLLCKTLEIDIVCMSAVSSILSDSKEIYDIVCQISQNSIILAALDNNRYITVPTCYPFVVGIQSDRESFLKPGEIGYRRDNLLYTDIYANCELPLLMEMGCTPSNSFAVPVVAAKINDWINEGKDVFEMLKKNKYHGSKNDNYRKASNDIEYLNKVPIIIVCSKNIDFTYNICCETMNLLHINYNIEASCLSESIKEYDIRFRKIASVSSDLQFMRRHYKTDIILFALSFSLFNKYNNTIEPDICVFLNKEWDSFEARYDKGISKGKIEILADTIYMILT